MSNESVMVAIAADKIEDFSEKFSTNKNERLKFNASISVTSKTTVHSTLNSFDSIWKSPIRMFSFRLFSSFSVLSRIYPVPLFLIHLIRLNLCPKINLPVYCFFYLCKSVSKHVRLFKLFGARCRKIYKFDECSCWLSTHDVRTTGSLLLVVHNDLIATIPTLNENETNKYKWTERKRWKITKYSFL